MVGTQQDIRVERLPWGPDLCGLEREWDALLERASRPTIFSSFAFVYASCLHFGKGEEVFFLFFRAAASGELLAIFPMSLRLGKIHGIRVRELTHSVTPLGSEIDKPYPIIRHDAERICWERFRDYFCREFRQWDVIAYPEFWSGSYLCMELQKLFPFPRYWVKSSPGPDSPIVQLDGDWDTFWMGHRKLRKKSRKLEKKLGENLSYAVVSNPAEVESCLDDYIATELAGWKAGKFVSSPKSQPFYRDLFPKMAAHNRLFFGMMRDRGKVVSVEIAYTFKDRVFFAHGTYDPAYADLSPGTVNSSRLIHYFHGKGFVEGDYLAGFSGYNNPWAHRIEKSVNLIIRRMGWRNGLLAALHLLKKAEKKSS